VHQKKEGDHLAERSEETKNELLAESERIIRAMLGKGRATVELL
ncbi:head completion/stabilization protein, partial [Vibrio fluvialis]|nr:head completion/stabilization protein [Vibrio fluvialis]